MKKVMEVLCDSNFGGAGRVLCNYLSAYDKSRYTVEMVIPQGSVLKEKFSQYGVKIHEITGFADRSYHKEDVKSLGRLFAQEKPDLVHTHGAFSGRVAAKQAKIPVVYSRHSVFPVSWKQKALALPMGLVNCHFADGIIAVSPAAVDNLVETGIPRNKITTIFNGVQPLERSSQQAQKALREELAVGDVFTMGILARLEEYKGHKLLLEACEKLKAKGKVFRLLIAGTGEEAQGIQAQIKSLGLEDCVLYLGFWEKVADLLSILDVQVNCSYGTEATSMSLLEGMSMGLPAVVSDYGGNPYVIGHGVNGLVFPCGDVDALVSSIERMMEDTSLQSQCSEGAKALYGQKFTAEVFARETEKFYDSVLQR